MASSTTRAGSIRAALVVEDAPLRNVEELPRILPVRHAAELGEGRAVSERRGVHAIVVARVHLPDGPIPPEQGDVEDCLEGLGDDIVAQKARAIVEVEGCRPRRAEVPALAAGPAVRAGRVEERAD